MIATDKGQYGMVDAKGTEAVLELKDVDQSGSMGESVIYSSIIACILASMTSLTTRIVAFDTNIVDLTEKSDDPVDLLFGFQLGGGTDID